MLNALKNLQKQSKNLKFLWKTFCHFQFNTIFFQNWCSFQSTEIFAVQVQICRKWDKYYDQSLCKHIFYARITGQHKGSSENKCNWNQNIIPYLERAGKRSCYVDILGNLEKVHKTKWRIRKISRNYKSNWTYLSIHGKKVRASFFWFGHRKVHYEKWPKRRYKNHNRRLEKSRISNKENKFQIPYAKKKKAKHKQRKKGKVLRKSQKLKSSFISSIGRDLLLILLFQSNHEWKPNKNTKETICGEQEDYLGIDLKGNCHTFSLIFRILLQS